MPIAAPGAQPVAEPTTFWAIYDDGSTGQIQTTTGEPDLIRPGRLVTEAEYDERQVELQSGHAAHLAELADAETAPKRQAYGDLLGVGLPEGTARHLSGYTPHSDDEPVGEESGMGEAP